MHSIRWLTAMTVGVALVLLACSSTGTSTAIHETAEQFFRALAADPPRAYTYLSDECRDDSSFLEFASGSVSVSLLFGESEPSVENLRVIRPKGTKLRRNSMSLCMLMARQYRLYLPLAAVQRPSLRKTVIGDSLAAMTLVLVDPSAPEDPPADQVGDDSEPSQHDLAVAAEADSSQDLPGEYVDLPEIYGGFYGNDDGPNTAPHTTSDVDYEGEGNSNPPAGGAHWGNGACGATPADSPPFCGPVPWGIYRSEWDAESLVHSMEHGGVVIWYNTTERDIIDELEVLVTTMQNSDDLIVMAPFLGMEDGSIALTSWSRIDKFPVADYSPQRVVSFLEAHVRRFNPEGF